MHTYFINTTVLALYYSNMFRPSKGHLQGVQMINFHNKMRNRCNIQYTEQRVLCSKHSVTIYQLLFHVLPYFLRVLYSCLLSLCFLI